MADLNEKSRRLTSDYGRFGALTIQSFQPRLSKPLIDQIDAALAEHYGFSDEQVDVLVNLRCEIPPGAMKDKCRKPPSGW